MIENLKQYQSTNPFTDKTATVRRNSYQSVGVDPLQTLKKGLLMSSFKSPDLSGGVTSPSIKNKNSYGRIKSKAIHNSTVDSGPNV